MKSCWLYSFIVWVGILAFLPSGLYAQICNALFSTAPSGGAFNQGNIFHINPETGAQTVDYSFPVFNPGRQPYGDLTEGGNGKFYGMTSDGGTFGGGVIFEWDPDANVYTKKFDFNLEESGYSPCGSLTFLNGKLYGLATFGGLHGYGTIFEWDPESEFFEKKIDFNSSLTGAYPYGKLTFFNGKFYGMTRFGGQFDKGALFEWDPFTNDIVKDVDFDGTQKGENPSNGYLTPFDGKLYGMTIYGGVHHGGVIFEWDPGSRDFTKKIDLGPTMNGHFPLGSLTFFNGSFYGMTLSGGLSGLGVIFEWNPVSNVWTKRYDFTENSKGARPCGSLTVCGNKLFGTTNEGGIASGGVLFAWDPVTNSYYKLVDFEGIETGYSPYGSTVLLDGKLYGMTSDGGSNSCGVIYSWDYSSESFEKTIDFESKLNGCMPYSSPKQWNGNFYGMTNLGGSSGQGVIYEWSPSQQTYHKLFDFFTDEGANPQATFTEYDGILYSVACYGGKYNTGVLFCWNPNLNTYTKLSDFELTSSGAYPSGNLTQWAGKLYGMAFFGGASNMGTIYEYDPVSYRCSLKFSFSDWNGSYPSGALALKNDRFYGMTPQGGLSGGGVIFEWDPATNVMTKKIDFGDESTGGYFPYGSLTLYNGKFYGLTYYGGSFGRGILFEWDPSTNLFEKKVDLEGNPRGSLSFYDGKFYGMTEYGGTSDMGTVFCWDPVANTYNVVLNFNGQNGQNPKYNGIEEFRNVLTSSTWTGMNSNDWFDEGNWNPGIPQPCTSVTIPAGADNYPTLTCTAMCSDILIQDSASFIGSELLQTDYAVVRYNLPDTLYHYISSPVSQPSFSSVFAGNLNNTWAYQYDEPSGNWINQHINDHFIIGTGYSVKSFGPGQLIFTGPLNHDKVVKLLSNNNLSGIADRVGWNLIGNPYSSGIQWDSIIKSPGVESAVYAWNGFNYVSYAGGVGYLTNGIIPGGNGFFVKSETSEDTIIIPLNARVHSNINRYKKSHASFLEISVEGKKYHDRTYIRFNDVVKPDFDKEFDAYKLRGIAEAPQLFSYWNGHELSINCLSLTQVASIDLGFTCGNDGVYKLTLNNIDNLNDTVPLILEDLKERTFRDLRSEPDYEFSFSKGDPELRFRLHFKAASGLPESPSVSLYAFHKTIVIRNSKSLSGPICIYDASGRLLFTSVLDNRIETRINTCLNSGIYLVKVLTQEGCVSRKVMIQ